MPGTANIAHADGAGESKSNLRGATPDWRFLQSKTQHSLGSCVHWRLEFADPSGGTHSGKKVIRTELVSGSAGQALAPDLEVMRNRRSSYSLLRR
jgi:hypothetical protein